MTYVFSDTVEYNQPLDRWDVSNVSSMIGMFYGAKAFNQSLTTWQYTNTTANMNFMLLDTPSFHQTIDNTLWDISILYSNSH